MDSFNLSLDDDHRMDISNQVTADSTNCQPSTSIAADHPFALSSNNDQSKYAFSNESHTDEDQRGSVAQSMSSSTPILPKPTSRQTFSFSKVQITGEPPSQSFKTHSSNKKKTAVKIASFAKASQVEHLSSAATPLDSPSHFIPPNSSGGSKQTVTQSSLPTPALNSALRAFFNYASQSEASPSTDASHSEEEDDDEDDEDENIEEEEMLVYMQFDSKLDSDLLQPHTPFKIIGVDSDKPVLQLGNQVFEGNWNDTIGTAVFFEENPSASSGDPVFTKNPPSTLNYHSKTEKALVMSRIFVKPKEQDEDGAAMVPMAIVEVAP